MTTTRHARPRHAAIALGLLGASVIPMTMLGHCGDDDTPGCGAPTPCEEPPYVLSAEVEILRDEDGVVHVYGQSDADTWYGSGYMQAHDRLFNMEMARRQIRGTRAEVLGPDHVSGDALIRSLDIARWGEAYVDVVKEKDPERAKLVQAWVAGVNRFVDEVNAGDAPMPKGFETLGFSPTRWTAEDAFVIAKTILFENANQLEYDILASLIAKYAPETFEVLPFFTPIVDEFIVAEEGAAPDALPPPIGDQAAAARRPGGQDRARGRGAGGAPALPSDARDRLRVFTERMADIRRGASNNWAIGPELTDSGRSIISGDPHQPLRSPSLFWLHHMNSADAGGNFDVVGWSFNGTPGISIGHNARIAWTATTNYPDVTDLWDVEVKGDVVLVGGEEVPLEIREEEILVAGGDPVPLRVEIVPGYGVLLPNDLVPLPLVDGDHRVLFNWTGYRVTNDPEGFFRFNIASDTAEFETAVDGMELASFNFVAATADDIVYRSSPIVPAREHAAEYPPYLIMDGSDPDALWSGELLDLDQMPSSRGEEGYIVTANNDPFGFTSDGRLDDDPYYFGSYFDPGTRAGRARAVIDELAAAGPITVEAMQELQLDTRSVLADLMIPLLVDAASRIGTSPDLTAFEGNPDVASALAAFDNWNHTMTRSSKEPVLFEAFMAYYALRIVGDDLSVFFDPIAQNSTIYSFKLAILAGRDPSQALVQEGHDVVLLSALLDAVAFVDERYGGLDQNFTWADLHETRFPSESTSDYDGGSVATDGSVGTVNVSEATFLDGSQSPVEKMSSSGGAIYRMTATFDDDGTPRAFFTMPRGVSGDPESDFYDNLTDDWVEGDYRLLRFKREDVEAAIADTIILSP